MENTNQSLFDLDYNENFKTQLKGAAVWAGIAAILSLAGSILGLVSAFMTRNTVEKYEVGGFRSIETSTERTGSVIGSVITLLLAILMFYFLNRFSSQVKNGLSGNNPEMVSNGFGGLANYFILIGVLIIICLVAFLILLAGVAAGSA